MKVALVTDTYHPQVNGVVSSVDSIVEEVGKEHEVRIFAPTNAKNAQGFRSFTFQPYPDYRIAFVGPKTIGEIFVREGIDLIHVHTPFTLGLAAVSAGKRLLLPIVGTFHTLLPEYTHYVYGRWGGLLRGLAWRYVSCFYRRCAVVTTPSNSMREVLVGRHRLTNVHVISNALNVDTFSPQDRPSNQDPVILYVGRLGREKKVEVLIDAAPRILGKFPRAVFRVVGRGVQGKLYEGMVRKKGLNGSFRFEHYLSPPDLVDAYRGCDVFVIPSDTETQGLVALEAMACGKPVVGADAGGLKDVITPEVDGYRFVPGSSEDLSRCVLELLADDDLRQKMGANARRKAEGFSQKKIAEQWMSLYSSLLGGAGRNPTSP